MTNEAAPSGAKSASKLENDVSAEKETSVAVGVTSDKSGDGSQPE
jgi:hypothetical protein